MVKIELLKSLHWKQIEEKILSDLFVSDIHEFMNGRILIISRKNRKILIADLE